MPRPKPIVGPYASAAEAGKAWRLYLRCRAMQLSFLETSLRYTAGTASARRALHRSSDYCEAADAMEVWLGVWIESG